MSLLATSRGERGSSANGAFVHGLWISGSMSGSGAYVSGDDVQYEWLVHQQCGQLASIDAVVAGC